MKFTNNDKWEVNSANNTEVNTSNGIAIADCSMSVMIDNEEKQANAKLIATSPVMLEMLKDTIKSIDMLLEGISISIIERNELETLQRDIERTIKKATE